MDSPHPGPDAIGGFGSGGDVFPAPYEMLDSSKNPKRHHFVVQVCPSADITRGKCLHISAATACPTQVRRPEGRPFSLKRKAFCLSVGQYT